jgi:hypothetical protein
MLKDASANGHEDIISWQPHGKAFRVHKPPEFAARVMACYFKQTQYKSFQRQLHIYGFRRITGKRMLDNGAYYHEQFIRGQKHDSLRMIRQKIKGNKKKEAFHSHSHSNPDFYATNSLQQELGRGGLVQALLEKEVGSMDRVLSRPPTTSISANESTLLLGCWATQANNIFFSRPASNGKDTEAQIIPSCNLVSNSEVTSSSLPGPIMDLLLHDGDEAFFEGMRFFCASACATSYCAHKSETS